MKKILCVAMLFAMLLCCVGCGDKTPENTEPVIEQLTMVVTQENIVQLEEYPHLKEVDLSGSTCYAAIEDYMARHPEVKVTYTVSLGAKDYTADAAELTLEPADYDFETLKENLKYLYNLKKLSLIKTSLTSEDIFALTVANPNVLIDYTIDMLGQELDPKTTTQLDLSGLKSEDVKEAALQLSLCQALTSVELVDAEGNSNLSLEDVKVLHDALPSVTLNYSFEFFEQTISTNDETVTFKNKKMGDEMEPQIRMILDIMNNCTKFTLDNCKFSNEVMAQLREDYRGKTKVVWRIWFGKQGTSMTDAEVLRATYSIEDDNCEAMKYLEDMRFMDLGHNEYLDHPDFIAGMPKLEAIIISGAPIKSLEAFANCTELKFLEMANCIYVPDLEPLRNCTKLEMLNISHTKIADISPLNDLNLTHLCTKVNKIPVEDIELYIEEHPDCWTTYKGSVDYGEGWRYDADDKPLAWYQRLIDVFKYPNPYNDVGWYLD